MSLSIVPWAPSELPGKPQADGRRRCQVEGASCRMSPRCVLITDRALGKVLSTCTSHLVLEAAHVEAFMRKLSSGEGVELAQVGVQGMTQSLC